jgi:hypothetical protein
MSIEDGVPETVKGEWVGVYTCWDDTTDVEINYYSTEDNGWKHMMFDNIVGWDGIFSTVMTHHPPWWLEEFGRTKMIMNEGKTK